MIKMKLTKGKSPVLVWTDEVESSALDQLSRVANLPVIHGHIAVMPDVHLGKGATVGSDPRSDYPGSSWGRHWLRYVRGANIVDCSATAGITSADS